MAGDPRPALPLRPAILLAAAAAFAAVACTSSNGTAPGSDAVRPTDAAGTPTSAAAGDGPDCASGREPGDDEVGVYFVCAHPDGSTELTAATRTVADGADPAAVALEALLAGPTPDERDAGWISDLPSADAELDHRDGTLVVDFDSDTINTELLLANDDLHRQIESTLVPFGQVEVTVDGQGLCEIDPECE